MSNTVVHFDSVSKKFVLSLDRPRTLQEVFLHAIRAQSHQKRETFWALCDVSFEIARGETVGIIGANGAGKSTVLKLASRIIAPTTGRVRVCGRVAALLELGTGFHPDLTGRENIYFNGSLMGLSREEMQRNLDAIIAFSELGDFIDMQVKHYSSGMYMRLGFSIAVHVRPDTLLIDEVLAVGDQAFQQKCQRRVEELSESGVTILFVSHGLEAVRSVCKRAIWIDGGRVRSDGSVDWVTQLYSNHVWDQMESRLQVEEETGAEQELAGQPAEHLRRWGSQEIEITGVSLLDGQGHERRAFSTAEPLTVRIHFVAHQCIEKPVFGLAIYRSDGLHITGPNTRQVKMEIPPVEGLGWVQCALDALPLLTGQYELSAAVYDDTLAHAYDHHHRMCSFLVRGELMPAGLIEWPGKWEIKNHA